MNIASFPNRSLIVISGPTAVGKTKFTVELAQQENLPIISADSRQFYKEMKIGTAYPSEEDLRRAKHYFVGMLSISDYYNVSMFEQAVLSLLPTLFSTHRVVIMEGGSPLYIEAVCHGIDALPDPDPQIRQYVNNLYRNNGLEALAAQVQLLDSDYFNSTDARNRQHLMRALEVCLQTGKPYSQFLHKTRPPRDFNIYKYYLNRSREQLFERINDRVDMMMEQGLLAEAVSLFPQRHLNALNTVGYKELFCYLDGNCSLEQAVTDIKTHTRRYAKKQLTWFKRDYEEIFLS